jgi:hypothetical protein
VTHENLFHPQVEALTSVRTQLPYEYYVLPFCNQGVDLNTQEALNLGEVRNALSFTRRLESPPSPNP